MRNVVNPDRPPGTNKNTLARYLSLIFFAYIFATNTTLFAADTWIDPAGDNEITVESPSFRFQFRYYMDDGADSFWDSAPKLYINDQHIWTMNELNIEGETRAHEIRSYDNDWISYEHRDYYIVLFDPYNRGDNKLWVYMEILPKRMKPGDTYKVQIKGSWCPNRNWDPTESVTLDCPFTPKVPINIIDNMGTFSRPGAGIIRYNKNGITPYTEHGFKWEFGFYKSSSYSEGDMYALLTLPNDANTTGSSIQWGGNANDKITTVYTKTYLTNYDQPYGSDPNPKRGTVYFYKEFGKTDVDGFIKASDLYAQPNMWDKSIALTWDSETAYSGAISTGSWLVWRYDRMKGESSKKVIATLSSANKKYTDKDEISYDTTYDYIVSFKPNAWDANDYAKDLASSDYEKIVRSYRMDLATTSNDNNVIVKYGGEELEGKESYTYKLSRKKVGDNQWDEIASTAVLNKKNVRFEFEDNTIATPCDNYLYRASIEMMDTIFYSNIGYGKLKGTTSITNVNASKGAYSNAVKLSWEVEQIGSTATLFNVYRRLLNDEKNDSWKEIYSTSGTDSKYSFEDVTAKPGQYYEYKVAYYYTCNDVRTEAQAEHAEGFCLSSGVITGKLAYATGTAAEGVTVKLHYADEEEKEVKALFSSLRIDNGGGVYYETADDNENKVLYGGNRSFSVQMWAKIDEFIDTNDEPLDYTDRMLFETLAGFAMHAKREATGNYRLMLDIPNTSGTNETQNTDILIKPDLYYHYTLSYAHETNTWSVYVIDKKDEIKTFTAEGGVIPSSTQQGVMFGRGLSEDNTFYMRGYIDEIRWWRKALTEKDILKNYSHMLSGTEPGLALYYPLDENIKNQKTAYDYSKTSDVANEAHGSILVGATPDDHIPPSEQFSLHTVTDAEGNYTLRGIPITSEGTNYYIVPTKGIHKFTPNKVTRFLSENSLIHNNVDFTDVSSFAVSGKVYYKNTLHPVSGVSIKVDGELTMNASGDISMTDENGEFTISVPVGEHYISLEKEGHTFANDGFYPAKVHDVIQTINIDREIKDITFTDMTKAVVAGRVSGGKIEDAKALGFGIGKANIGKAVIKLTTGYDMNMVKEEGTSDYVYNTDTLQYELASDSIKNCKAYVGTSNENGVRTITIETDPDNGEFAVLLPPADYKVTYATIPATGYEFANLPNINVRVGHDFEKTDSIPTDSLHTTFKYFDYHASLKLNKRNNTVLEVKDLNAAENAFGEEYWVDPNIKVKDRVAKDSIQIYSVAENGDIKYIFDYPIYFQNGDYELDLYSYEEYVNMDDPKHPITDKVPNKNSIITIDNEFGDGVAVDKDGNILQKSEREVELDSLGHGTYYFKGGLPNIQGDYTLSMNISYDVDGNTLAWSENGKFKAILLGALPTGNNFVTKGPDKVIGVLRDPPGSNSYTSWEKGHTITNATKTFGNFTYNGGLHGITSLGASVAAYTGFAGIGTVTKMDAYVQVSGGMDVAYDFNTDNTETTKVTLSETISTSNNENYVGGMADVFVGLGTNLTFGEARAVCFNMTPDSAYYIDLMETVTMGEEFTTSFQYTQTYIETNVIPNLKKLRNAKLLPKGSPETNNTNSYIYISKLEETDPKYGSSNYDKVVWGNSAVDWDTDNLEKSYDGPSYKIIPPTSASLNQKNEIDTIQFYNNYIDGWIYELRQNDSIKVAAINKEGYITEDANDTEKDMLEKYPQLKERNISFDGGTTYQGTWQEINDTIENTTHKGNVGILLNIAFATKLWKIGTTWNVKFNPSGGGGKTNTEGNTGIETVKYVLADTGFDAFSVDVYTKINEKSPIFYTRGGKSRCPYEGEVKTKYYEPGEHTLAVATQKIEYPRITCDESIKSGVPSEEAAYFTIKLRNFSETNTPMWYDLSLVEDSNPDGLEISMDGGPVEGSFYIPGNDSIVKTVTMRQGNPSILNYNNIRLRLASQCQNNPAGPFGEIADTVSLSVQFVPSCSNIRLQTSTPILNKVTGGMLQLTIDQYDLNRSSLKGIEVQVKAVNDTIWNTIKRYVTNKDLMDGNSELLDKSKEEMSRRTIDFDMSNKALYPDQTYLFRAITICNFGKDDVNNESEEICVIKDMNAPTIIAIPNPSDGVLNAGDEISIIFNEDIMTSSITDEKIKVTGILNEVTVEHNVTLKSDENNGAQTEATIDVNNSSFAVNMWLYYKEPGAVFNHGTDSDYFKISIDEKSHLCVSTKKDTIVSKEIIPANKWLFLTINCEQGSESKVTADIAYDDKNVNLFKEEVIVPYSGNGNFTVGKGFTGSLHEISLWNYARTTQEALSEMYMTKHPYTRGLVGYWKMDEGHGDVATDKTRGRHMILANQNGWNKNNVNMALELKDKQFGAIDISKCTTADDESYLVEFWFKADVPTDTASIICVGNEVIGIRHANQHIELTTKEVVHQISTTECLDGNWHHMAVNVLKQNLGSAIIYLDGKAIYQLPAKEMPSFAADQVILGAKRNLIALTDTTYMYTYSDFLDGNFDEFRYWKGNYSSAFIKNHMYQRVKDGTIGLQAYYPFEKKIIDEYNQAQYVASLTDHSSKGNGDMILCNADGQEVAIDSWTAQDAPALTVAPTTEKVNFSYTTDERKLIIKLEEDASRLEGARLTFKVSEIRDMNNNLSEDITWMADIKQSQLSWEKDAITIEKKNDETVKAEISFSNTTGGKCLWVINSLPTWLEVDAHAGILVTDETQTITLTVPANVGIGRYEETIYLTDQNGLKTPLIVNVVVKGNVPDWSINPDDFESSMNIIAQVEIKGEKSQNTEDIIAAFRNGKCVGIAHPEYSKRYDAYYVMMNIYGDSEMTTDSIFFKVYEAATGTTYPSVKSSVNLIYVADAIFGDMNNPIILSADNKLQQDIKFKKGWKWITLNVDPQTKSIDGVFTNCVGKISTIKRKQESSSMNSGGKWYGNLTEIIPNTMYKVYSFENFTHSVQGKELVVSENPITLYSDWNWIGYTPRTSMSIKDALAGLNPIEGDIIKSQFEFSIYTDYEWIGTLQGLNPGEGYAYKSNMKNGETTTFTYPTKTANKRNSHNYAGNTQQISSEFKGNMNIIATVMNGEDVVTDAQIYVYDNDTLSGVSSQSFGDNLHFLTIHGNNEGKKMSIQVEQDGLIYEVAENIYFAEDAIIGNPKSPYVIQLDGHTNANDITIKQDVNGVTLKATQPLVQISMYNTSGQIIYSEKSKSNIVRISTATLSKGSYIIKAKNTNAVERTFKIIM